MPFHRATSSEPSVTPANGPLTSLPGNWTREGGVVILGGGPMALFPWPCRASACGQKGSVGRCLVEGACLRFSPNVSAGSSQKRQS